MAEGTREDAQQRRSEGRERRRSMLTEPFERLSDAASGGGDASKSDVRDTVKRAAVTAAVAAAVGAAAGVAKTLLDRRGGDSQHEEESEPQARADVAQDEEDDEPEGRAEPAEDEEDEEPEGRAEAVDEDEDEDENEPQGRAETADEDDDDEPEGRAEGSDDDEDEQQEGRAEPAEQEDDQQQGRAEPAEATGEQEEDDADDERESLEGAADAGSEPSKIVPKARRELEQLLGREAESVSGFERENGHWKINLEVVELSRIPDSADVLGSYELVLDDEGKLARMTRTRRYQRSEVESG